MRSAREGQADLFEGPASTPHLAPDLQSRIAPLLRDLLAEAIGLNHATVAMAAPPQEAGDDQDHA